MTNFTKTFSLTFGDVAENHKGMQQIGKLSDHGFDLNDLNQMKLWFEEKGCKCKMIHLSWLLEDENVQAENPAYLLVIKDAVNAMLNNPEGANELYEEQDKLEKDTKAFMYGRVVNKHARHNLCFADQHQEPTYEEGKGRVYAFDEVPILNKIRSKLGEVIGEKGINLQAEGNYYYDAKKCGIGYHGDSERKKVAAIRLGATIPLCYAWYHNNEQVSEIMTINDLEHGDMYVMSEKTTGYDWKSRTKWTLRHAAGSSKYTSI